MYLEIDAVSFKIYEAYILHLFIYSVIYYFLFSYYNLTSSPDRKI